MPAPRADARVLDIGRRTRVMSWIMAAMLLLTVLAAALGAAMWRAATSLDRELAGRMTVQLASPDDTARQAVVGRLLDALRARPEVTRAAVVDRERLAALLEPWLGSDARDPDLPMPVLLDIDLRDPHGAAQVERTVRAISPDARVDRDAAWLAPVRQFLGTLAWLAVALVLLVAGVTVAVVVLAARSGLDTHRDTIEVLHMLGSTDVQVARLFQRRIALDTLTGGLGGTVVALALVGLIGRQASDLGSGLVHGAMLGPEGWAVLAALPFLFALLAMAVARFSVLGVLRRRL